MCYLLVIHLFDVILDTEGVQYCLYHLILYACKISVNNNNNNNNNNKSTCCRKQKHLPLYNSTPAKRVNLLYLLYSTHNNTLYINTLRFTALKRVNLLYLLYSIHNNTLYINTLRFTALKRVNLLYLLYSTHNTLYINTLWLSPPKHANFLHWLHCTHNTLYFNPLNAELNSIRHLLALVGARHIVHVSRIRVNTLYLVHRMV